MASIVKVDTIQDQDGNNIINESADTITIGASGDTITVPTGATLTVPNGGLTGQNYPAFEALGNGTQNLSNATETLVEFPNERFDTNSCYDNTSGNYKFTPNVAGKYFIYTRIRGFSTTDDQMDFMTVRLYKNGNRINTNRINTDQSGSSGDTLHDISVNYNFIQEANGTTDYFQIKAQINVNSGTPALYGDDVGSTGEDLVFGAFRIGA